MCTSTDGVIEIAKEDEDKLVTSLEKAVQSDDHPSLPPSAVSQGI